MAWKTCGNFREKVNNGTPIIYEQIYINENHDSKSLRKIELQKYVSDRLVVNFFCSDNNLGLEVFKTFSCHGRGNIDFRRLYSRVTLESNPVPATPESLQELWDLLSILSKYSVPENILSSVLSSLKEHYRNFEILSSGEKSEDSLLAGVLPALLFRKNTGKQEEKEDMIELRIKNTGT